MNRYIQQGMMLANSNAKGFEYGRNEAQRESAAGQMQGLVNRDNQGYLSYDPASPALSNPYVVERVKMAIDLDRATQQARQARMLDLIRQMQIDETARKVAAENNRQSSQEALFARPAVPTGRRFMPDGSQVAVPMTQPRQQSPYIPSAPGGLEPLALPEAGGAGPESLIPPGLDRNTAALMTPDDLSRVVRSRVAPSTTTSGSRAGKSFQPETFRTPAGRILTRLPDGSWTIDGKPGDLFSLPPEELNNARKFGVGVSSSGSGQRMTPTQTKEYAKLVADIEAAKADQATADNLGWQEAWPPTSWGKPTQNEVLDRRMKAAEKVRRLEETQRKLEQQLGMESEVSAPTPPPAAQRPAVTPAPVASPAASPAPISGGGISAGGFPAPSPTRAPTQARVITSKAEFDALPSGSIYTNKEGRKFIKP